MGKYGLPSAGGVSVDIVGLRAWTPPVVGVQIPDEKVHSTVPSPGICIKPFFRRNELLQGGPD
jgi:hypothetical protein